MILVNKGDPPDKLVKVEERATAELCRRYEKRSEAYDTGEEALKAKSTIYSSKAVKKALAAAHRKKCCYCETSIEAPAYGHVEHWRPKGGVQQSRGDVLKKPGYYWLAYDWSNLFWSCGPCNCEHKKNLFPIADESTRALNHTMPIEDEEPMLLNPAGPIDPREHIAFHEEVPYGITELGRRTIDVLRLDEYRADRSRHFAALERFRKMVRLSSSDDEEVRKFGEEAGDWLAAAVHADQAFSAMVQDQLAQSNGEGGA